MKRTFTIAFIISLLIITSCIKETKSVENENPEFEFVILGTAKNGNGKKLGLNIPSLGMDNRLTSEIINGKFEFKGKLLSTEKATIAFDNELEYFDGSYSIYEVFLTKDTISIDVTVDEKYGNLYFSEKSIMDDGVNTYFQENNSKFWDAFGRIMINPRDSVYMDSLRKNVFPSVRKNIISVNQKIFNEKEYTIIGLSNLRTMFEERFVFDFNEMSDEEKKSITDYFNEIDKSLTNTPDYIVVSSHIKRMNNRQYGKGFMNFSLPNIQENNIELSKIISMNEFTVLDFWWSGCAPCRKFNQESKEHYRNLKDNGIEIISINVDDGMKKWRRATEKDSIEWINLYAGSNSKIQADYNVVSFPTTIIFNKNNQLVDFDFHKATELLKLKK